MEEKTIKFGGKGLTKEDIDGLSSAAKDYFKTILDMVQDSSYKTTTEFKADLKSYLKTGKKV